MVLYVAAKWIKFKHLLHWSFSLFLFHCCPPCDAIVQCGIRNAYNANAHSCVALYALDIKADTFFVPMEFIIQFIIRLFSFSSSTIHFVHSLLFAGINQCVYNST